jgi:RNA polymerase-interacting CarD/CdnL/TRCF family regulator
VRGPSARHPNEQREQLPAVEGAIVDADELKPGDRVVYPNQGVHRITGVVEMEIRGERRSFVRMQSEESPAAAVSIPREKIPTSGLRRVATGEQMEGVFHYLAAQFDDPELDWKVRHRDNADRLVAGGVLGVAEVVKGLHSLSRLRPLPTKEREQYDNARHLLVHEVAVSLGVPAVLAEDYVDFALMPPAGVKFALKPPPKPVLLPSRPKKRRPAAAEEDDLGLADLGLDIDLAGALEGAAALPEGELPLPEGEEAGVAVPGDEGAAAPAGGEDEPGEEPEVPARAAAASRPEPKGKAAPPKPARAKPPAKPARPAPRPKPRPKAAAGAAKKRPAKPAAKPAAKRGGKKR